MIINDVRNTRKELSWSELKNGQVYVSNRLQKYILKTSDDYVVCLDSGELFDPDECMGDVFNSVNAKLEVY